MKHLILTAAAALMLLSSCNQEKEWSIYDGDYTVDANTVITLNGKDVLLSDYENAVKISLSAFEQISQNEILSKRVRDIL